MKNKIQYFLQGNDRKIIGIIVALFMIYKFGYALGKFWYYFNH